MVPILSDLSCPVFFFCWPGLLFLSAVLLQLIVWHSFTLSPHLLKCKDLHHFKVTSKGVRKPKQPGLHINILMTITFLFSLFLYWPPSFYLPFSCFSLLTLFPKLLCTCILHRNPAHCTALIFL